MPAGAVLTVCNLRVSSRPQVRSVLIKRAGDVRYDPPLLAACAHDIITHCDYLGADTAGVLG
mgnify:CR=1 FL=1